MTVIQARWPRPATQVPDELLRSAPRQTAFTATGKAAMVMAAVLAVGACFFTFWLFVWATRDAARLKQLDSESSLAYAEVVSLSRPPGNEGRWALTYRYVVGGESYRGRATMRGNRRGLGIGSSILVRYFPSTPSASWMVGSEPGREPKWGILAVPFAMVLAAVLIAYSLHRQRKLLSEGRAALARVTRSEHARKGDRSVYRVWYEFKILSGATCSGRCDIKKKPPPAGVVFVILYDPEEPHKSASYPFTLVRPG